MYNNTRYPKDQIMAKLDFIKEENQFPKLIIQCTDFDSECLYDLDNFIEYVNLNSDSIDVPESCRGVTYGELLFINSNGEFIVSIPATFRIQYNENYPGLLKEFSYGYGNNYEIDCDGGSMMLSKL